MVTTTTTTTTTTSAPKSAPATGLSFVQSLALATLTIAASTVGLASLWQR